MLTKTFIAAGALLSVAAAVPLQQNKRDVVWTTKVEEAYVTVDVTTTIWLNPGETPPAAPAEAPGAPGHYGHHGHHHKSKITSHITSTIVVPSSPPAPSSPASPSSPAETTESPAPAPTETYAPSPTTTAAPSPPPQTYSPPAPQPTTSQPAPEPAPSSAPSSGSGGSHVGDITYYTPGMGSCGITSTESEAVVALPEDFMSAHNGANPNTNPFCGKTITISYGGKTTTAKVVDTCPGCSGWSIDLSPTVFSQLAPLSEGRVSGVKWSFT